MDTSSALYKAIVCVDIERFTDSTRIDPHRMEMRKALYRALEHAFARSRIVWARCYREDRGDGAFLLVDPDIPKARLVEPLPFELAAELARHNHRAGAQTRIRLRVAINAGEIYFGSKGVVGDQLNRTFRLLDAPEFKRALRQAPGDLAFIASDGFYQEVIRQRRAGDQDAFRLAPVTTKNGTVKGWIYAAGVQLRAGRAYGEHLQRIGATLATIDAVVAQARRDRATVVARISSPVPEVPDICAELRERLSKVKKPLDQHRWAEVLSQLIELDRAAGRSLERARTTRDAVRAPLGHRDALRGRLASYQAMARDYGRVEDPDLRELYERADGLLWSGRCDLAAADAATMDYIRAIQRGPSV